MEKPWSGRFGEETLPLVERFTESVSFDRELFEEDIAGSIAHAEMLAETGIISRKDARRIVAGLRAIRRDIVQGRFDFKLAFEDIHMNIEAALAERIGKPGRKLHTARSRNDQIALDLKLWTRKQAAALISSLRELQRAFVAKAGEVGELIMPAFTHLQPAQPILVAHYLLAFVEMFERDIARLGSLLDHTADCPLGSGAVAGTTLPINRKSTARKLGFARPTRNSLDAVSDRDFLCELAFCLSMTAMHLSRWAEDWVIFSSERYGFLDLPEKLCTGSSIMPQKKNPDTLELVRGKTARVYGALTSLLVLLKGLPFSYDRDLQEDKEPIFDAARAVTDSISVATAAVGTVAFNRKRLDAACEQGYLDATALAEYMVGKGVPFRDAHRIVGQIVRNCIAAGVTLSSLPLEELRAYSPTIEKDVCRVLGPRNVVAAYRSDGSSSPSQVRKQIAFWRRHLRARKK